MMRSTIGGFLYRTFSLMVAMRLSLFSLFRQRQMPVVVAYLDPGRAGRVLATVFAPLDVRALAKHVGLHKRADVQAHSVVQARVPANGLLLQRLPADENVVRNLAFEDHFELILELLTLE